MADPTLTQWAQSLLTGTVTGGILLAGAKWIFKLLVEDRIKRAEDSENEFKKLWKDAVQSRRSLRREIESEENGAPSVPPPPAEEDYEDETGVFKAIDRQDRPWEQSRTAQPVRILPPTGDDPGSRRKPNLTPRQEQHLKRYTKGDPLSTPPEPHVPRKKLPSRPR